MTDPLNRRLDEVNGEVADDEDRSNPVLDADAPELVELGGRIRLASTALGVTPSLASIEASEKLAPAPELSEEDSRAAMAAFRDRLRARLPAMAGAPTPGAWVSGARKTAGIDQASAALSLRIPAQAYRQVEADRMPLWRVSAERVAPFCRRIGIDGYLLVRWMGLNLSGSTSRVYGRLEGDAQSTSRVIQEETQRMQEEASQAFDTWSQAALSTRTMPYKQRYSVRVTTTIAAHGPRSPDTSRSRAAGSGLSSQSVRNQAEGNRHSRAKKPGFASKSGMSSIVT